MKPANRNLLSALLVVAGAVAVAMTIPSLSSVPIAFVMAASGAVLLFWLAAQLKRGRSFARDILLIAFVLLLLLAGLTLLSGFSLQWTLIGLFSLYIVWSLVRV